jgi:hypothetical protein
MLKLLPRCPVQGTDESSLGHGLRILAFMLAENVTATLSDLELERAEYAAGFAVTAREILPLAVDRISDIRHVIACVLKARQTLEAPIVQPALGYDSRPAIGPMAPLPERPKVQPPAPEHALTEMAERRRQLEGMF